MGQNRAATFNGEAGDPTSPARWNLDFFSAATIKSTQRYTRLFAKPKNKQDATDDDFDVQPGLASLAPRRTGSA